MKRKIHRRRKRNSFLMSRRFAVILIGLGFGLAFGELLAMCMFEGWKILLGGLGFGAMIALWYDGLMQELEKERERQRTWDIRSRQEYVRHAAGNTGVRRETAASRVRSM